MGLKNALTGQRVYVDANVLIYLVEAVEELRTALDELRQLIAAGAFRAFTSEFSLCEVLVQPFRRSDEAEVEVYRSLIERSGAFDLIATDLAVHIEAAHLRSAFALRTPDALNVACALRASCSIFLSNHKRLRLPAHLRRVGLE